MPLIQSKSKKAFKKNIEVEMEAGKPQKQSLAIAFNVQRKNKRKKMADGGAVLSKDQESVNPKKNPKIGDKYEGDNNPGVPAAKPDDMRPAKKEYMANHFSQGGSVYDEREAPAAKPDNRRPDSDNYMDNDWTGEQEGPGSTEMHKFAGPSKEQYMADHMQMLADGGHVACTHCGGAGYDMKAEGGEIDENYSDDESPNHGSIAEAILAKGKWNKMAEGGEVDDPFDHGEGISHFQEEGPGERRKFNQYARDYNQGDDRQISKQPKDSNEKGDEREDESENKNDRVGSIRKKMRSR